MNMRNLGQLRRISPLLFTVFILGFNVCAYGGQPEGQPVVFYVHPWEIDPGQPRLPVSMLNRIRHYRGLDTALARVDLILNEFSFSTIASYLPTLEKGPATRLTAGAA